MCVRERVCVYVCVCVCVCVRAMDSARRRVYWSARVSVSLIPMAASSFVRYLDRGKSGGERMGCIERGGT